MESEVRNVRETEDEEEREKDKEEKKRCGQFRNVKCS